MLRGEGGGGKGDDGGTVNDHAGCRHDCRRLEQLQIEATSLKACDSEVADGGPGHERTQRPACGEASSVLAQ